MIELFYQVEIWYNSIRISVQSAPLVSCIFLDKIFTIFAVHVTNIMMSQINVVVLP